MALTPEEQQRADELARLMKEYDEDEAAAAAFQKALADAKKSEEDD